MFNLQAIILSHLVLYTVSVPAVKETVIDEYSGLNLPETEIPDENNASKGSDRDTQPIGSWSSTLSAFDAALALNSFVEAPQVDVVTDAVFWVESNMQGRNSIYQFNPETDTIIPWTPENFDVRSSVNNRDGGSFLVYNNTVIFTNSPDGLLYSQNGALNVPEQVTTDFSKTYANGCFSPEFNILFYIAEYKDKREQALIAINMTDGLEIPFPVKHNFLASPSLSPDNTKLAWIQWKAPNMVWDETSLVVSSLKEGDQFKVVKYIHHSSLMMPKWNQYNELLYVHDATNYWNLYINNKRNYEINLTPFASDVGKRTWRLGQMAYDTSRRPGSYDIVAVVGKELYQVDSRNQESKKFELPYDSLYGPKYSNRGDKIYLLAGNATQRVSLIELNAKSHQTRVVRPKPTILPLSHLSHPQFVQFSTLDEQVAFGLFYPPKNSKYVHTGPTLAPLIVTVGEGPPQGAKSELDLRIQFFTSRGFAFFDVDHRGRGDHGRSFRQVMDGRFGHIDVEDVIAGTEYIVKKTMADPNKIVFKGAFLGGVTGLLAMASSNLFRAGVFYGSPSNVTKLLEEAPLFEGSYFHNIFPISAENTDNITELISPINVAKNITSPTLFFHGLEDHLVHPNHSVAMHEALLLQDIPTTLILKPDEGHKLSPKTTAEFLEEEFSFYKKILEIKTDRN